MPPNIVDIPVADYDDGQANSKVTNQGNVGREERGQVTREDLPPNRSGNDYKLRTFLASLNLLAHILIGAVTAISLLFAFRNGLPLGATPLHIVLCVIGYQFLMAEAILSLAEDNGWSSHLRLVDKRRAHLILQLLGSVLAIVGSFIKILDKTVHWNTLHGQFALVALVFTSVSLVNGLTSLWAYELRKFLPGTISKLTHICFGTVAFVAAGIALCYGFEKGSFRNWISDAIAYTSIAFTAGLTFITILAPTARFYTKSKALVSR